MTWWMVVLGTALLAVTVLDVFATIASTGRGNGIVVDRLNLAIWRAALAMHRRRPSHWVLSQLGIGLLVLTPITWIAGMWTGWTLLFASDPQAVVESESREPATLVGRIYFAGFNLFTLGLGDLHPGGDGWRILAAVASMIGLALITLSITYLVPVVQAATQRRQLARTLCQHGVGRSGCPLSAGVSDSDLVHSLTDCVESINASTEQHLTHRVLRYYHSDDAELSLPVQVCRLSRFLEVAAERWDVPRLELHRSHVAVAGLARALANVGHDVDVDDAVRKALELDGRDMESS